MPPDLVTRLRETLTGEDTDEAMWRRIVAERQEAAAEIARLRAENERLSAQQVDPSAAIAAYLRVCSSGGMPKDRREQVQRAVDEAARLGYFAVSEPFAAHP